MEKTYDIACHECDLLVQIPTLSQGNKAVCPRCRYVLTRYRKSSQEYLLALSLSAIVLFVLSLSFEFMSFSAQGIHREVTLLQSIESLEFGFYWCVSLFLVLTTLVIPAAILLGLIYLLISLRQKKLFWGSKSILKSIYHILPWNMGEIFLVGLLVSLIKITALAKVSFGMSLYAYIFFIINITVLLLILDRFQLWQWLREKDGC